MIFLTSRPPNFGGFLIVQRGKEMKNYITPIFLGVICNFMFGNIVHAHIICGIPQPEVEGPDGFIDYMEDNSDGYSMYYSCWSGDPLTSNRISIFDWDHEYGYVCLQYDTIVPEVEPDMSSEAPDTPYQNFNALGYCSIIHQGCHPTQYWDSENQYCTYCVANAFASDWDSIEKEPKNMAHKNTSCYCLPGYYMNAGTCKKCPAPGETLLPGITEIGQCMLIAGYLYSDETGKYEMTADCLYQP